MLARCKENKVERLTIELQLHIGTVHTLGARYPAQWQGVLNALVEFEHLRLFTMKILSGWEYEYGNMEQARSRRGLTTFLQRMFLPLQQSGRVVVSFIEIDQNRNSRQH